MMRIEIIEGATNHHLDRPLARQFNRQFCTNETTVAKYRNSIGDTINFIHAMADEHHSHALFLQVLHNSKEPFNLPL